MSNIRSKGRNGLWKPQGEWFEGWITRGCYREVRKANKSGLGFQGVARVGNKPARRQNRSSASRFICRLEEMYRLVVATLACPR